MTNITQEQFLEQLRVEREAHLDRLYPNRDKFDNWEITLPGRQFSKFNVIRKRGQTSDFSVMSRNGSEFVRLEINGDNVILRYANSARGAAGESDAMNYVPEDHDFDQALMKYTGKDLEFFRIDLWVQLGLQL